MIFTRKTINRLVSIMCVVAGMMPGMCEEEQVSTIRVEPVSFGIRTYRLDGVSKKGAEVRIEVTNRETEDVKEDVFFGFFQYWIDHPSEATVSLVDSRGEDLGSIVSFSGSERGIYHFTFSRFPSPEAEWVRLKGSLPMSHLVGEIRKTEPVAVRIKEGHRVTVDGFDLEVSIACPQRKYVVFTVRRKDGMYGIPDWMMTHMDGKEVDFVRGRRKQQNGREGTDKHVNCFLKEWPDEVMVSFTYRAIQIEEIPLDLKLNIYSWNE